MTACCRSYSAGQEPRSYGHPIAFGNPDVGQKKFQLSCSYEYPPIWNSNLTFEHGNSTSWILSALSGEMSPIKSVPNSNCEPLQIHHHEIQGVNPFNKIWTKIRGHSPKLVVPATSTAAEDDVLRAFRVLLLQFAQPLPAHQLWHNGLSQVAPNWIGPRAPNQLVGSEILDLQI